MVHNSIGVVTALLPHIGYKKCTEAADRATKDKRPVADLIVELGFLSREEPISPRCRLFSAAFEVVFRWFQVVVAAFPAGGGSVLAT